MKSLERFLISLDCWPWSAIYRVAIGLCMPPAFRATFGGDNSVWAFSAFLIAVLVILRIAPAALRRALPFSAEAKELWAQRRYLAKRYDSYQWQKLFWIGLGLLPHLATTDRARMGEIVAAGICLIGGSFGLLIWRKVNSQQTIAPPL